MRYVEAAQSYCKAHFARVSTALLLCLFAVYQLEFLRYRPYDIDNPWFLSFSYNQHVYGAGKDTLFSQPFPLGMDGTYLFGRIAAGIQSAIAAPFHWQQRPVAALSALCITLALACFIWALRRRGQSPFLLCLLLVTAGLSEPLLSAANRLRYEPFSYLLVSGALLLTTFDLTFLAVFVAALAVETEPAAILGVLPVILACVLPRENRGKRIISAILALAAAFAVDLMLHPAFLHPAPMLKAIHDTQLASASQYLSVLVYFLIPRHVPEVLLLVLGPILYVRRGSVFFKLHRWEIFSFATVLLVCPILRHPNSLYVIFLYPLMLLVVLTGFERARAQAIAALVIVLYFVPQYAYAAWANRGQGYTTANMGLVRSSILQTERAYGLNDETLHITGDYSLYFAHPHNFHAIDLKNKAYFPLSPIVLCFDGPRPGLSQPGLMGCDEIKQFIPGLHLSQDVVLNGSTLHILAKTTSTEAPSVLRQYK